MVHGLQEGRYLEDPDSFPVAPARAIAEFQAVQFNGAVNVVNPWKGPPSASLDAAWSELYEGKSYDDPAAAIPGN